MTLKSAVSTIKNIYKFALVRDRQLLKERNIPSCYAFNKQKPLLKYEIELKLKTTQALKIIITKYFQVIGSPKF